MQSRTRRVNFEFYQLSMEGGDGVSFEEVLHKVAALPQNEERTAEVRGRHIRLQEAEYDAERWMGELVRIRMDQVPIRASLSGKLEPFLFDDDEGVGEEAAFLYWPRLKVLVLQRNRLAVSTSAFTSYFVKKGDIEGPIVLMPILQGEAYQRLGEMQTILRFDIRIAGIENMALFDHVGYGLKESLRVVEHFNAPTISVSLSMGHRKGSLVPEAVRDVAKKLCTMATRGDGDIRKIEVAGKTDIEADTEVLDLLEYRMVDAMDVQQDEHRSLTYSARQTAMQTAFSKRRSELMSLYATEGT